MADTYGHSHVESLLGKLERIRKAFMKGWRREHRNMTETVIRPFYVRRRKTLDS